MSGSKCKSSGDITGTVKKRQAITMETKVKIIERVEQGKKMVDIAHSYNNQILAVQHKELTNEELEAQRKDKERNEEEEVTEELKRFTMQEMARRFSLSEEALLVFEAQDLKAEWYMKDAAAVQNAIQCYHVIYDGKKRATTWTSLDCFSRR